MRLPTHSSGSSPRPKECWPPSSGRRHLSVRPPFTDPTVLSQISLFQGVPARELERLATLLHRRTFPAGTNVITAEEPGGGTYIILSGTAKVYVTHTDGMEVILAILGPDEIVGEMSVADSLGRSASVLTLEESS